MKAPICFVIMPFRAELNFFFLYLQNYLHEKHGLHVERGDHRVLTKPLMDKIREQILSADIIIAEITGSNPNVFYELGLAHAFGKPVIFLTREPPEDAPVDIKQFEYIHYDLGQHHELLATLDKAIHTAFAGRYKYLYNAGCELIKAFNRVSGSSYRPVGPEKFQALVIRGEQTEGLPDERNELQMAEFVMPKILAEASELAVMRKVTDWIDKTYG